MAGGESVHRHVALRRIIFGIGDKMNIFRVYLCRERGKGKQAKKTKYVLRWDRPDGTRAKKSLSYISKLAAEACRRRLETELNVHGEPAEQAEAKRKRACRWSAFRNEYMGTKEGLSYSHRQDTDKTLRDFSRITGVKSVQEITKGKVQRFHAVRCTEVKPITANRSLQLLAQALDYAVTERLIDFNPAAGVKKRKVELEQPHGLTDPQAHAVLDNAPSEEWRVFYGFCLGVGCRRQEAMYRVWGDITYSAGVPHITISQTKDKEVRTLAIPPWLDDFLLKLRAEQRIINPAAYICPTVAAMHPDTVTGDIARPYFDSLGQPDTTIQSLRRTFGVRVMEAGALPFQLQAILGHSSVTCSERWYTGRPRTDLANLPPVVYNVPKPTGEVEEASA